MEIEEKPDVTYDDVGGCADALRELREVVETPLLHPERFTDLGIDPPKGVLLYGPPGTGKTLSARAVANRTEATFIRVLGSELEPVERLKAEFEPQGIRVFPISAVAGQGLKELLYYVKELLDQSPQEAIVFEPEYFPQEELVYENLPYTVTKSEEEEGVYIVEGPRIEKMLGYTNLDSEKGFAFFQNFLKNTGILDELEAAGIQEGDTVRMYGLAFDYYR